MKKNDFEQAVKIRTRIVNNENTMRVINKAERITLVGGSDIMINDPAIVDEVKKTIIAKLREQNAALENEFASL